MGGRRRRRIEGWSGVLYGAAHVFARQQLTVQRIVSITVIDPSAFVDACGREWRSDVFVSGS